MALELMEFRFGEEYDSDKLWLTYKVGTTEITVTTSDSQYGDRTGVLIEGNISQLREWLSKVDGRMHGAVEDDT